MRLGDFEDYNEGPALKLWLTAIGWARESRFG